MEQSVEKYDVKKVHRDLYSPRRGDFAVVEVPPMRYLAIDGHGDPNTSEEYADAVGALYAVGYTLKFADKKATGRDLAVGPLEGLWRAADPQAFVRRDKTSWEWTMLVPLPEWIGSEQVEQTAAAVREKKNLPAAAAVRVLALAEGTSLQILHVGSYDDEGPVLARLHDEVMPDGGWTFGGDHHEIYLNDPRRTEPSRLRTILRQPVRPI
ncbi:GyrI-like domain-containing protein [Georgenia halophila]|uniref:GyrI-like domain-containing protein n=1 Tax=Georgenia halophila TaxID=620889 RepID=A0ABP8LJK7_9MICO